MNYQNNHSNNEDFCLKLFKCNTEDQITKILEEYGFSESHDYWQNLGHSASNWSIAGNQQSSPVAALAEKVVNAEDAVLINACLVRKIDPKSSKAPNSMTEAVETFFNVPEGRLENLDGRERTKLAEQIQLISTGEKNKDPCYTIIDSGEGQTPPRIPETILSLPGKDLTYKSAIKFVQGLFNMGGTGALRFCGQSGYQLVISRRNPDLPTSNHTSEDKLWGFTLVRRRNPSQTKESSVYEYLAPEGKIPSFCAESLSNLLGHLGGQIKSIKHGTCIKLYEYSIGGLRTSAILDLNYELSRHFQQMALPMRVIECREKYKAHSNVATLAGMSVRLSDNRSNILEEGFPADGIIDVEGIGKIPIKIYAFSSQAKENLGHWVGNKAIVFTINGQMHGSLPKSFLTRKEVGLSYIRDYVMLVLDCTDINGRAREDLFMASRDRLSEGELTSRLQKNLAEWLGEHEGLQELAMKRREEALKQELADDKPFKEILGKLIKTSPSLSSIFYPGLEVIKQSGFKWRKTNGPFVGKTFPTFFRLKDGLARIRVNCPSNSTCKVVFETDAANDYFERSRNAGKFDIKPIKMIKSFTLWNGIGTMKIKALEKNVIGEVITITSEIKDKSRIKDPFISRIDVKIVEPIVITKRQKGPIIMPPPPPPPPPGGRTKQDIDNGTDGDKGILLPEVVWVNKGDENWDRYNFDEFTGLKILSIGKEKNLDIYLNRDNVYLNKEIMYRKTEPEILREQFKIGLVLGCLGIYHHYQNKQTQTGEEDVLKKIDDLSIGLAQVILSIISVNNLNRLAELPIAT